MQTPEVPQDPQQPTPQQETEQVALAFIEQKNLYLQAIADAVVEDLKRSPEQLTSLVFKKIEDEGTLSTTFAKFQLGQPFEIKISALRRLILGSTWAGWAVRIPAYVLSWVLIGTFFDAVAPRFTQTQTVQSQQQQGR